MRLSLAKPGTVRCRAKGFSLVEAVIAIVVLAAFFIGISYVMSNTTLHNADIDRSITAIFLAREKMDTTMAKDFANISSVAQTAFTGDYAIYRYQIDVTYVNAAALDTSVPGPTEYKRIVVLITATGWTGNVRLYDLKVNI